MYTDEQMLMLSGIQHFMFCQRQWALIHIEQQWADNRLTAEGRLLHQNVDNPFYRQKNGEIITLRSVHLRSRELGLYGIADTIELRLAEATDPNTINHPRYEGRFVPYPVEYKHGRSKPDERDAVQLAAQVMCLEEMHGIHLSNGAFFYAQTRRREEVKITAELRQLTISLSKQMHAIMDSGRLPQAMENSHCKRCSLVDICMPAMPQRANNYLKRNLYEETT